MGETVDESMRQILTRAASAAEAGHETGGMSAHELTELLHRYYRHSDASDLAERDPTALYRAAASHHELAASRPQGTANVAVRAWRADGPAADGAEDSRGRAVVEVVTDDMPFLVDSVAAALTRMDLAIETVVHPQITVRRDVAGSLLGLAPDPAGPGATHRPARPERSPQADQVIESWIHVEVAHAGDRALRESVEADLRRVLGDVRDAVQDWQKMGEAALRVADELTSMAGLAPEVVSRPARTEAADLLSWLADNHFTFLGYREYELGREDGEDVLRGVPGTGLGILRGDSPRSRSFEALPAGVRARAREPEPLIVTKSTSRSTVRRPAYMDYLGVRRFDADGRVTGECRFLGLFSRSAYAESVLRTPVVRRKVDELFELTGFAPNSHNGRDLLEVVETYPRDELFQITAPALRDTAVAVLHLKERRRVRLFLRMEEYGRFASALVYLPRERFKTEVRLRMQDILAEELHGINVDYTTYVTESVLARLHFTVRLDPDLTGNDPAPDVERVEARLAAATREWSDDFADAVTSAYDPRRAGELIGRYGAAFPAGYQEHYSAREALADVEALEALAERDGTSVSLYEPAGAAAGTRRFKMFRTGAAVSLSHVLPVLARMGVEVTDERPYAVRRTAPPEAQADAEPAWIYDFGLRVDTAMEDTEVVRDRFEDTVIAVRRGAAESDGFNRLVLTAGLTWRQAGVLRAYVKYLRQAGTPFNQDYIEQVLGTHATIVRLLVSLFEARFDPAGGPGDDPERVERVNGLHEQLDGELDAVPSLDADRIMRGLATLITATLRTNYYQTDTAGEAKPYLSIKLAPHQIPDLPEPRPQFEIWVYAPRTEGVHLRFGPVARGGLRWSDRREDFRTEVLGLVKAQMVKNAVIVPVGSKGGFVVKQPPAGPEGTPDREALREEGIACYTTFIRGMLDLTDNLVDDRVVAPQRVVRYDGDDSYLVVAADKGTASFSDIANSISTEYGYWLGDAFASGGSVGYDHKEMAITARGTWESVRRHFRERGIDCQREDFTCVGIGDMSGDVFGGAMLLSRHIRLVAAFDHRHIFLDPDPDAARSFTERERLARVPRSTWADYDPDIISPGGGVYPRTAKSVPITAQVRARLDLPEATQNLTPNALLRAILSAEVDLLFNGGIGTYVKAGAETHADVGDKTNDAIRVDGSELRAACVAEGGNLGLTQRGRIEYARTRHARRDGSCERGRINTDAIDNSAGVDTSDHEVNIKILLESAVSAGELSTAARNELLAELTGEVARLVLRDNYGQNIALAGSAAQAPALLHAHARHIRRLEADGDLDRELEFLPSEKEIAAREQDGQGLVTPELAVLLAYTKITLTAELLSSDLPEGPALNALLHDYFPEVLAQRFAKRIDSHPLRRQIATTSVVNNVVNNAGITFVHRLREETGAAAVDIVRAHVIARDVFDLPSFHAAVEELDNELPASVQTRMRLMARRLAERGSRWLLHKRQAPLDVARELETFRAGVGEVVALLPQVLQGRDADNLTRTRDELVSAGVRRDLAERAAVMDDAFSALDIVAVARDGERAVAEVAEVYFLVVDELSIAPMLDRIDALPRDDRWSSMARASLREELFAAQAALTADVLTHGPRGAEPQERFDLWRQAFAAAVERAERMLTDVAGAEEQDLATMSVVVRSFRRLVTSSRAQA